MAEAVFSTDQGCGDFQLQLDRSNSKSIDMERASSHSMDGKEPEASFSHFSGLEALNPQKRELLEARFSAPRPFNQDSQSNASSVGSDKELDPTTPGSRPEKYGGRKRKAIEGDSPGVLKTGRPETHNVKITEFFKQNDTNQSRTRSPQNLLPSFNSLVKVENNYSASNAPTVQYQTPGNSMHAAINEDDLACISVHESCQTSLSSSAITEMEEKLSSGVHSSQKKDSTIEELKAVIEDYKQQFEKQKALNGKIETSLKKCMAANKELLVSVSVKEKKEHRHRLRKNKSRLGHFVLARKGAQYQDTWEEGHAFKELNEQQMLLNIQKEELEKQKKQLLKRKPGNSASKEKKASKSSANDSDSFQRPLSPILSSSDYYEREEIIKIRATALKKEENDLQLEIEKLDKQRNLHLRESKRIRNEDESRFNKNPQLNGRYLLLNLLGKGGFSEVYKGYDLLEHRYVACKIHQLVKEWKEDKKKSYIRHSVREYNIHKTLIHSRIVRLFDVFEIDNDTFCTVMEYCDGQDLDFLLKQNKTVPERDAKSIIMQMVSALKYLNEIKPPVIHYDLKPANILLVGKGALSGEVKVTDFGLSKILENDEDGSMELTSQGAGTYWYLPPECFEQGKQPPKISSKVDVWSVGVIFYQMLFGKKPFGNDLTQAYIIENQVILKAKGVEFPNKPAVSNECKNFIRKCLCYRKEDRADVFSLSEDSYLKPPGKKSSTSSAST